MTKEKKDIRWQQRFDNYGLDEHTLEEICRILERYPQVTEAVLYGSRAKGNYKPFSDIDLTLKGDVSLDTLLEVMREFEESSMPYLFDVSVFNNLTNEELIDHIARCGKKIYDNKQT